MNNNIMKILPVFGPQDGVQAFWQELLALGVQEDFDTPNVIMVLGGDGTMLGAQEKYAHVNVPFLGIGFGSVNFLLNRDLRDARLLYNRLHEDAWRKIQSQALTAHVICADGDYDVHAYNDIYIKSQNPAEAIRMKIVAQEDFPRGVFVKGDGVIVANPNGSTAYNKNAGGTVLPLKSPLWALTAICASQNFRVTLEHQEISITLERSQAVLVADNRVYNNVQKTTIKASDTFVTLLFDENEDINQRRYSL